MNHIPNTIVVVRKYSPTVPGGKRHGGERAVQLCYPKQRPFFLNPTDEPNRLIGSCIGRRYCVKSFCLGLVRAGWSVQVNDQIGPDEWSFYRLERIDVPIVSPLPFLYGLAFGSVQWVQLKTRLKGSVVKSQLEAVMASTARHYLDNWHEPVRSIRLMF